MENNTNSGNNESSSNSSQPNGQNTSEEDDIVYSPISNPLVPNLNQPGSGFYEDETDDNFDSIRLLNASPTPRENPQITTYPSPDPSTAALTPTPSTSPPDLSDETESVEQDTSGLSRNEGENNGNSSNTSEGNNGQNTNKRPCVDNFIGKENKKRK